MNMGLGTTRGLTTSECAAKLCEGYATVLGGAPSDYADVFNKEYVRCEIRARRLLTIPSAGYAERGPRQRALHRVLLPDFYAYVRTFHARVPVPAQPMERRTA